MAFRSLFGVSKVVVTATYRYNTHGGGVNINKALSRLSPLSPSYLPFTQVVYKTTTTVNNNTTTPHNNNTQEKHQTDYGYVQDLLERDHFVNVRKKLEADDRKKITIQEFHEICDHEGLSKEQSERLVQSLSDAGIILYFPNSTNKKLQHTVYLKPQDFNTVVNSLLDHNSPEALQLDIQATQAQIAELESQLQPLQETRDQLERRARRRANLVIFSGLGYCTLQFLAIGRLTWWELSWDVMEPVTYMLTFATALIGYGYFVLTGSEYTYEGLKRNISERRFKNLVKRTNFDEVQYKKIQRALSTKQDHLSRLYDDVHHNNVLLSIQKGTYKTNEAKRIFPTQTPKQTAEEPKKTAEEPKQTSAPTPKAATS